MPNRKISIDIKERALHLISTGKQASEVAALLGVAKRSLGRWQAEHDRHGHLSSYSYLRGRPRKLTPKLLEEMGELIRQSPDMYLEEIVQWYAVHRDLSVSIPTVHRALKRLGLSYKKLRRVAAERDDISREQWKRAITSRFTASQLVFADESSKDNRTVLRRYGRAPRGERAVTVVSADRGLRYSILPALSVDGILTVRVVRGSVDGQTFFDWVVSDLLPKMNPFPGPNSILVVDNCRTHKSESVREVVEAAGCVYVFLPAYSPDLNPIEEAFSAVKYYLRQHPSQFLDSETPEIDLMEACMAAVTPEKAAAWYRHSGYM